MSGKKKLSLQDVLDSLQNLQSEISDVLTDVNFQTKKSQQIIHWSFGLILKMTIERLYQIQGSEVHAKRI
ncbi:hypothetical protein TNCV_1769351 [Trichonephila clavipes]|nr:hypothetical protein TNCV_1769351 [Trichonephila clavipes]